MTSYRIEQLVGRLLDQAEAAADAGDWPTVAAKSESILLLEPGEPDATSLLAAARRVGGDAPMDVEVVPANNENHHFQENPYNFVVALTVAILVVVVILWGGSWIFEHDYG